MATVHDMLKCPKCSKQMMGKSHPQTLGKEYFCHFDHEYFGVNELVNQWGYDAGDLYPNGELNFGNLSVDYNFLKIHGRTFLCEWADGEPYWESPAEYQDAQAMVTRMIMGIPEIDDYFDLLNTQNDALGVGLQ